MDWTSSLHLVSRKCTGSTCINTLHLKTSFTMSVSYRMGAVDKIFSLMSDACVYYLSNRPQVSMGYKLINQAGCW